MRAARDNRKGGRAGGLLLRLGLAVAGVASVALLVDAVGADSLVPLLERAAPVLPLVLALELARQACDAAGTYLACGDARRRLPFPVVFRAQLVGHAIGHLLPAGRMAGEGSKAAMVGPFVGSETAAAAALTSQAMSLVAAGIVSAVCCVAALARTGLSTLTTALLAHVVVASALGGALFLATRSGRAGRVVARLLRRITRREDDEAERAGGPCAVAPLAARCIGRVVAIAELSLLAIAAGVELGVLGGLIAGGLQMLSLAAGCFVPGQLGVTEGSLVVGCAAFDATAAQALSIGLLFQTVQVVLVPVGAWLPMVWKTAVPATPRAPLA